MSSIEYCRIEIYDDGIVVSGDALTIVGCAFVPWPGRKMPKCEPDQAQIRVPPGPVGIRYLAVGGVVIGDDLDSE